MLPHGKQTFQALRKRWRERVEDLSDDPLTVADLAAAQRRVAELEIESNRRLHIHLGFVQVGNA